MAYKHRIKQASCSVPSVASTNSEALKSYRASSFTCLDLKLLQARQGIMPLFNSRTRLLKLCCEELGFCVLGKPGTSNLYYVRFGICT